MKFSHILMEKGINLAKSLNSDGEKNFSGGYLAVHLRRGDFLKHRQIVSLEQISKQIITILNRLNLSKVFLATDGTESGIYKQ